MSTPDLDMKTPVPLDDTEFIELLAEDIIFDKKQNPTKFEKPKNIKKKKKKHFTKSMSTNFTLNYDNIFQDRYTSNKPIINKKPSKKLGPRDIGYINTTNWQPIEISENNENNRNNKKNDNIKKVEKKLGPIEIGTIDYNGTEYKINDNDSFLKEKYNYKHTKYCDKTCNCNLHYKKGPIEIGRIDYDYIKKRNINRHKRNVSQPNLILHGNKSNNSLSSYSSNEDIEKFINSMKEFSMSLKLLEDDQEAFKKEVGGFIDDSNNVNIKNKKLNRNKSLDEVINDIENEKGHLILDKVSEL